MLDQIKGKEISQNPELQKNKYINDRIRVYMREHFMIIEGNDSLKTWSYEVNALDKIGIDFFAYKKISWTESGTEKSKRLKDSILQYIREIRSMLIKDEWIPITKLTGLFNAFLKKKKAITEEDMYWDDAIALDHEKLDDISTIGELRSTLKGILSQILSDHYETLKSENTLEIIKNTTSESVAKAIDIEKADKKILKKIIEEKNVTNLDIDDKKIATIKKLRFDYYNLAQAIKVYGRVNKDSNIVGEAINILEKLEEFRSGEAIYAANFLDSMRWMNRKRRSTLLIDLQSKIQTQ